MCVGRGLFHARLSERTRGRNGRTGPREGRKFRAVASDTDRAAPSRLRRTPWRFPIRCRDESDPIRPFMKLLGKKVHVEDR